MEPHQPLLPRKQRWNSLNRCGRKPRAWLWEAISKRGEDAVRVQLSSLDTQVLVGLAREIERRLAGLTLPHG